MKHNYISCDCCGKILGTDVYKFYRIKHGLRFTWLSDGGDRVDICQNCWNDIQEYVKEKRNATMA